jgi:hypothetical protein
MPRVTIAHDDETFRQQLIAVLSWEGFEVVAFNASAFVTDSPRASDRPEIAITQVVGGFSGIQIRVTGFGPGSAYAGPLSWVFTGRATVADVMEALRHWCRKCCP